MTPFLIAGLTGLVITELIIFPLTRLNVRTKNPKIWFGVVMAVTIFLVFLLGITVLGVFARPDTWIRDWRFYLIGNDVAQLVLGAAFGVVLAYWASLLLQPNAVFFPPAVRRAHNIWGIVLAVMLVLGISLPYQAELFDRVQQVSTPAFKITLQSKQRERNIPLAFKTVGSKGGSLWTERGKSYFLQITILDNRIPQEKRWTKLLGYPEFEDSYFDDAQTFISAFATPLIDCVELAKDNFHSLSDLRLHLAPVATKLRQIISRSQRGGMAPDAVTGQSLIDEIDRSITEIDKLLTGKQKCRNIGDYNVLFSDKFEQYYKLHSDEANQYYNYYSDKLLRSLSERVPYLHILLADIYRFNENLDGAILILERAAHNYFRKNLLFAFRLEFILQNRLREWNKRTDLFLTTIDAGLELNLQIMFQSAKALEREGKRKDKDQKIIEDLTKLRVKTILFKHNLQNIYAYFAAKALLANDDAKVFISQKRISDFVLDNQTFALSKQGSGMHEVLGDLYGAGLRVSNFEIYMKSQFLDTLAVVKTARVHQRAKNNPFLSTGEISDLKRALDEAINYFNDALMLIKGGAEEARKSFPTSFQTGRNSTGDGENFTQKLLLNLKPNLAFTREEIRENRDLAIYLKDNL